MYSIRAIQYSIRIYNEWGTLMSMLTLCLSLSLLLTTVLLAYEINAYIREDFSADRKILKKVTLKVVDTSKKLSIYASSFRSLIYPTNMSQRRASMIR